MRRRRIRFVSLVLVLVAAAGLYAALSSVNRSTAQVSEQELLVSETPSEGSGPVDASGERAPVFARLADNNLVLPVAAQYATIIAYYPSSDERAVPLSPIGAQVNGGAMARTLQT